MPRKLLTALAATLAATAVHANDLSFYSPLSASGFGLGAAFGLSSRIDLRVEYAGIALSRSGLREGVDFDARHGLAAMSVVGDWYFGSQTGFRLGAGLVSPGSQLSGFSRIGGLTPVGTAYPGSGGSGINLSSDLARVMSPYVGLGWGTRMSQDRGFGLRADLGLMYSRPDARLGVGGLAAESLADQRRLQDAYDRYRFYPVISAGMSYRF